MYLLGLLMYLMTVFSKTKKKNWANRRELGAIWHGN